MPYTDALATLTVTVPWIDKPFEINICIENYAPWLFEWSIGYWAYIHDSARGGLLAEAWRPTERWARNAAFKNAMRDLYLPKLITSLPIRETAAIS